MVYLLEYSTSSNDYQIMKELKIWGSEWMEESITYMQHSVKNQLFLGETEKIMCSALRN